MENTSLQSNSSEKVLHKWHINNKQLDKGGAN